MELLTGSPLDEMIRNSNGQGLGRARSMKILAGIANGLAYAHAKGLVHADLKPSNIFLTEDEIPKILDLGIARAVPGANNKKDSFDVAKLGAYTAAYATAEMIEGSDPNKADDVYALGLIAYEMLTSGIPTSGSVRRMRRRRHEARAHQGTVAARMGADPAQRRVHPRRAARRCGGIPAASAASPDCSRGLIAATLVLVLVAAYFDYALPGSRPRPL